MQSDHSAAPPSSKMTGLEVADLREIPVLSHVTDEEQSTIKFAHVFGSGRSGDAVLSALYVTTKDEVFLAGLDRLVGKSCTDRRERVLKKSLKVEELSGKSVRRIVVGEEFGAALTEGKDLYLWGAEVGRVGEMPAELSVMALERHYRGATCSMCSQTLQQNRQNYLLSACCSCAEPRYQNRVSPLPPPSSWTGRPVTVVGYPATTTEPQVPDLFCLRCRDLREIKFGNFSNFEILLCSTCNHLLDGHQYLIPPQNNPVPHKVTFPAPLSIVDIAAGSNFLLIQTIRQLIIWGDLGRQKYNHAVNKPDKVSFSKVACGAAHIAVITDRGDLYTCGVGDVGQLGYTWAATHGCMTLKKVTLEAPAVDVACGLKSTIALLQNRVQIYYGNVSKVVIGLTFSLNIFDSAIICIPTVLCQNYTKVMESTIKKYSQSVHKPTIVTGDLSDVFIQLHGATLPSPDGPQVKPGFCAFKESKPADDLCNSRHPVHKSLAKPVHKNLSIKAVHKRAVHKNLANLFGQHLFSDLKLKLADGDFPVHRSVLYMSSVHFSQSISDSKYSDVLDMSSYKPSVYRGLLQYMYGVPLSQMTWDDLFDLYVLATSYNEDWVATDVLSKLHNSINPDNVLLLFDKAKAANATEIQQKCQAFMNAPEFKKTILDRISQNDEVFKEALRLLSNSKN